ncbi:hypothetical protein E2C01_054207 [Portunus trituberculatus]|uniref:Uncharacterized protein n=1 Tax=Portunus trituberculatus TaxID=210409 RepID=A0A5B7GRD7_PORTR|nr:hypothetical protein [Portunus trituberculatus]
MLPFDTLVRGRRRRERVESSNYEFVPAPGDQSEILQLTGGNQVLARQVGNRQSPAVPITPALPRYSARLYTATVARYSAGLPPLVRSAHETQVTCFPSRDNLEGTARREEARDLDLR